MFSAKALRNGQRATETHLAVQIDKARTPQEALITLRDHYLRLLDQNGLNSDSEIVVRLFLSDISNQASLAEQVWPSTGKSLRVLVGQAPLDSVYCSLQAWHIRGAHKRFVSENALLAEHGGYSSLHHLVLPQGPADSYAQSHEAIAAMLAALRSQSMTLEEHVQRTWYYLRDIDNNYAGMVKSRREQYEPRGLTPQTHFTASTGIEGCAPCPGSLVWLQTWAMRGLEREQIRYLHALSHLSPTVLYGVNFERATHLLYGDMEQCLISGTASIDHEGRIVHEGDVERQLDRVLENMAALLSEADMTLENMRCVIVYLRDSADYQRVRDALASVFPDTCAVNVVRGAVCRPGWLIEMEGMAAKAAHHPQYANYC